jgi:transcriptional regulator
MYQPPHFREERLDVLHDLIRTHNFGAMVTIGEDGFVANHFPFVLDASKGPFGTLRAHMAKANNQWRDLDGAHDALVIFRGAYTYITPAWYATKAETGKVVPTWNYALVHVHGRPRAIHDPEWLVRHVSELTDQHEADRAEPWTLQDAPADFVAGLLKGIVGIELEISRIEGKWKASQNRPEPDRAGVVQGLTQRGDERSLAMADLVATR